uniref:Uncharacterized protein n=1 Tax=Rhizophora mucronata TaxID=61149 RepID=A0A2P2QVP6_RHIMU
MNGCAMAMLVNVLLMYFVQSFSSIHAVNGLSNSCFIQ